VSDASRELASDLAVRALGLTASPSRRIYADVTVEQAIGGIDDTPYGAVALAEDPASLGKAISDAPMLAPVPRAGAWNAIALATGPGDGWVAGGSLHLDDEPLVRFQQYKALGRLGTKTALEQLTRAASGEREPLLAELLIDTLAIHGIGLARRSLVSPAAP